MNKWVRVATAYTRTVYTVCFLHFWGKWAEVFYGPHAATVTGPTVSAH